MLVSSWPGSGLSLPHPPVLPVPSPGKATPRGHTEVESPGLGLRAGTVTKPFESNLSSGGNRRDFPGGPVVENPPSNAGDVGSIPGWETKVPHAVGQLSPRTTTREARAPQQKIPCAN